MSSLLLVSPFIFGFLAVTIYAVSRQSGWSKTTSAIVLTLAVSSMAVYTAGFVGSIVGDAVYGGSGEPFDWGPHYLLTVPLLLGGILLAPASAIVALAVGLANMNKRKTANKRQEEIPLCGTPQP